MTDNAMNFSVDADLSPLLDSFDQARGSGDALFKAMERSSDRAIASMMRGMQTWSQAVGNIVRDMEIKFAQLAARKVLNWAAGELGMTQATEAGNAARLASDEGASAGSIASMAGKAVSAILNDAKEVFGGIFAFLAPAMGPAAAGPAAAGSASVSALAGGILYAESGAWNIPSDTFAYLHAGEMVVPQSFASNLRDGAASAAGIPTPSI